MSSSNLAVTAKAGEVYEIGGDMAYEKDKKWVGNAFFAEVTVGEDGFFRGYILYPYRMSPCHPLFKECERPVIGRFVDGRNDWSYTVFYVIESSFLQRVYVSKKGLGIFAQDGKEMSYEGAVSIGYVSPVVSISSSKDIEEQQMRAKMVNDRYDFCMKKERRLAAEINKKATDFIDCFDHKKEQLLDILDRHERVVPNIPFPR